jgi:signal transduction histidine kinase
VGAEGLAQALPAAAHTLVLPFSVGGRTTCLLVLARSAGPAFDETDLAHLGPMADVALLALRNAHLHAQTERAERAAMTYSGSLQRAIEAAEAIGSGEDLSDVVERVLQQAVAVVHAERGSICRVEGDTMVLEHDYDPGARQLQAGVRWRLPESPLAAEAIRRRAPLRGVLSGGTASPPTARWLEKAPRQHVIQCPLMVEREVVGLLGLSRRRDESFTEADLQALHPFATLAGLLLRNARLLADARRVGQAKSAFLNLAAHELRTPLAVIKGYLSLLEDGTYPVPNRTREEAVDTLVAKAQELESLVDALLTTARLEVGTLPSFRIELDLAQSVRDAVARVRPRARLEGARIELRLPAGDVRADADRGQVARILDNLLNNALTYSARPAMVEIEVREGPPLEVAVRDRGQGISADQRERVFERFYRVDASRSITGMGLGLSISRELAQLNGGALVLEQSAPGEGSVFVLRLPAPAPVSDRSG